MKEKEQQHPLKEKLFPDDGLIYFDPVFKRLREPKKRRYRDRRCQILEDNLKNNTTHTSA